MQTSMDKSILKKGDNGSMETKDPVKDLEFKIIQGNTVPGMS